MAVDDTPPTATDAGSDRPFVDGLPSSLRYLLGLVVTFALFHTAATHWQSTRGEAGWAVAALVLTSLLLVQRCVLRHSWRRALAPLGRPRPRGMVTSGVLGAALLVVPAAYSAITRAPATWYPGGGALLAGLFLQAGVAEEALFRGYGFGLLRPGRTFRRAAWLACLPFAGVHALLFATFAWPVALASLALALLISFPLAHLYELCGRRIWGPAIVHAVVQAVPKLVELGDGPLFPLVWMVAAALLPYGAFLVPRDPPYREGAPRAAPVSASK